MARNMDQEGEIMRCHVCDVSSRDKRGNNWKQNVCQNCFALLEFFNFSKKTKSYFAYHYGGIYN